MNYPLSYFFKALGLPTVSGLPDLQIDFLATDSRQVFVPERTLFFAIKGKHFDGHRFIEELYQKGVRCFCVSDDVESKPEDAVFFKVKNTISALHKVAAFHRKQFDIPIIAITGSHGKTIVKEWLYSILSKDFLIIRNPKSYNSQIGVPLSVWNINSSHTLGIFEAGISQPDEMENLSNIINGTIGIFTNVGAPHSEGFSDDKEKIKEKIRLFESCEVVIYRKEYEPMDKALTKRNTFSWSTTQQADLTFSILEKKENKTECLAKGQDFEVHFEIPFSDEASVENALHCFATAVYLKVPLERIVQQISRLEAVAMRLELKKGINQCTIINDSYSADLSSLQIALSFMKQQLTPSLHPTVILSDIFQSGIAKEALYAKIAELILETQIKKCIIIGHDISLLFHHLNNKVTCHHFEATQDFLKQFDSDSFSKELVLIKGARRFAFEKIAQQLEQKIHQTVLEINLTALLENFQYYKSLTQSGTGFIVMVKASGYGSGALEVAKLLEKHVAYFAVAYTDEGVELRKAGIKAPIFVMNPEEASYDHLWKYAVEPEVYSPTQLKKLIQSLPETIASYSIHLKLDTGMHRLGLEMNQLDEILDILQQRPEIKVASIFTHLSASDMPEHDDFSRLQLTRFHEMNTIIAKKIGYQPPRHALNTAGMTRFPEYHMEMVRLGIGLYGIDPTPVGVPLKVVQTLKARISQVKTIEKGDSVGYCRMGISDQSRKIAIISIGYADGLPRAAGQGKFSPYVNGKPAPIIGNVCMDMTMLDVSAISDVNEGDEVIIFGQQPTVESLATATGTIPYEIFTGISERVKRIYFREG